MPAHDILKPLIVALVLVAGAASFAQDNPVKTEMVPFEPPIDENPVDVMEQQYQMQLLQQEVMELRGLVEELSFQVQSLKEIQDDRYLELDRRLQSFGQAAPVADLPDASQDAAPDVAQAGEVDDKSLYDTAIELIRNRQYEMAIEQLRGLIDQYPDSVYTANAYYWIGEVYVAMPVPDYEEAQVALAQVIAYFPDHHKVPDASFKLGTVYHLMGNCERGKEILLQVAADHQGKSVGKLAEAYLRDKIDC